MQKCLLVTALCVFAVNLYANDRFSQTSVIETQFDTNLVNSPNDNEPLSSWVAAVNHTVRFDLRESQSSLTKAVSSVAASAPTRFTDLNQFNAELGLRHYWQPGLGYRAPWLIFETTSAIRWHNFEQHRWLAFNADAKREQRLNDRIFTSVGLSAQYKLANEAAFEGLRGAINAYQDWRVSNRVSLYAQQQIGLGRMTTSYHGALSDRGHHLEGEGEEEGPDSVSNTYFADRGLSRMLDEDWYTYGVDGWFAEGLIGINIPVISRASIDLAYRFHAEVTEDVTYSRQTVFVSMVVPW